VSAEVVPVEQLAELFQLIDRMLGAAVAPHAERLATANHANPSRPRRM
jgi:hypothetical protein